MPAVPRSYHQVARAAATQDMQRRIVDAFADALRMRWVDEITLDDIAATAGTTRQTVIRMFGGKEGLARAVADKMSGEIAIRRALPAGSGPRRAAHALVRDYEITGDVVIRVLAQESRHKVLTALLNVGRRLHREWVTNTFTHALPAEGPAREALITQLVVATDVYTWKLLRRDFHHSAEEVETLIAEMITKLLG